eukprot:NODE_463_length_1545_cov_451.999329.p1 GENE.NODE_463_length_1545_cov_451.999329~~NODE_463_length_1545_cov_451.999329.p1  ORF type:complete len:426 (+),score=129.02 NODE_463_length_1545_cov_451.999329:3-1280(+)
MGGAGEGAEPERALDLEAGEQQLRQGHPRARLECARGLRQEVVTTQRLVQRYVDRPLLVNGYKFDLRLYVVVTSYDPLKIYLNSEGLVRLATARYDPSEESLSCRHMHLTNYSVNKHSEVGERVRSMNQRAARGNTGNGGGDEALNMEFEEPEANRAVAEGEGEADGEAEDIQGLKWSLAQLREHFENEGIDYDLVFVRIKDVLVKTILAAEPVITSTWQQGASYSWCGVTPQAQIGPNQTCFEMYGFDVMVDDSLKPWLLEVNIFPSLSSSSPFDKCVKTQLVADMLTLVGIAPFEHDVVSNAVKDEQLRRLQGLTPRTLPLNQAKSHTSGSISSVSSLRDLGESEWRTILDAHDEYMRRGRLDRIFPTREAVAQYAQFFSVPRYSNLVLQRWLEAGGEACFPTCNSRGEAPPWVPNQIHFEPC